MAQYPKPWTSFSDQLDHLTARGMTIADQENALKQLSHIGYYRLSGYWNALRQRHDQHACAERNASSTGPGQAARWGHFKPGATFQHAVDLYNFDKQLRLLAIDALEIIEVALRVDVSHRLGGLSPFAYTRADLLHGNFTTKVVAKTGMTRHEEWLARHDQLISRSREDFIRHCKAKYGLPLPVWIAAQVWDFGTLSTLFSGLRTADQDAISSQYGMSNGRVFASWLRSFNYLRNVCAHHSRLWNRNIIDQPKLPPVSEVPWVAPFVNDAHAQARCFLLLCMVRHVLGVVDPTTTWVERVGTHLHRFPLMPHLGIDHAAMGAPPNWAASWSP